jgi:hypothetical protein
MQSSSTWTIKAPLPGKLNSAGQKSFFPGLAAIKWWIHFMSGRLTCLATRWETSRPHCASS